MSSKTRNEASFDANLMSNLIYEEIFQDFDYGEELGTVLFDTAVNNLASVNTMREFSINMMKQIEFNGLKTDKPEKIKAVSVEDKINAIQKDIAADITKPIQNMFDDMSVFVCQALLE